MAALGSQSIASSYEQLLQVDADGGGNGTTHVSVKDGDNGTTFGFTIASDALMMSSTNRLEFGDTGTYIHQSADGVLDLVSDTEIELNGTIDINGAVDMSSTLQVDGSITSSDGATITTADNTDTLSLISTDADANAGPNLRLYRNSSSPADSDIFGQIDFEGRNDNSQDFVATQIKVNSGDVSDGTEQAQIEFDVMTAGTLREYMRLAAGSTPSVVFNQDSRDIDFRVLSDNLDPALFVQGSDGNVGIGTAAPARTFQVVSTAAKGAQACDFKKSATAANDTDNYYFSFQSDTTEDGYILNNGSANLAIASASDERLKKNIRDADYGLETVMALRPVLFDWKADNGTTDVKGFIGQEVQEILPKSVSVMPNGYIGMDTYEFIPVLIKAVQELSAKVEALEG